MAAVPLQLPSSSLQSYILITLGSFTTASSHSIFFVLKVSSTKGRRSVLFVNAG